MLLEAIQQNGALDPKLQCSLMPLHSLADSTGILVLSGCYASRGFNEQAPPAHSAKEKTKKLSERHRSEIGNFP